jgi:hypothetical protein
MLGFFALSPPLIEMSGVMLRKLDYARRYSFVKSWSLVPIMQVLSVSGAMNIERKFTDLAACLSCQWLWTWYLYLPPRTIYILPRIDLRGLSLPCSCLQSSSRPLTPESFALSPLLIGVFVDCRVWEEDIALPIRKIRAAKWPRVRCCALA